MIKKYTIVIFAIFSMVLCLIPSIGADRELGFFPENVMVDNLICSPKSNIVALVVEDVSGTAIYKGDISTLLAGASYNKIVDLPSGCVFGMEMSPDGEHIAYVLANETGEFSVHKLKIDGTEHSLFYIAPNTVNELLISWSDNEYLICSDFEDFNSYPVTKISINNQSWSLAIEPKGYLAAALPYGNKVAYTKYGVEDEGPPNHAYIKNSTDATGGPGNGDILISSNLFGDMHVFSKKWFGSSLYYLVDDWNDCEDGEPGTVRLDRAGQTVVPIQLSPDNFSVTNDNQYIVFDKWNEDESDSKTITITSSTGSVIKEYTAASEEFYSSPEWSYDNNYVLWVKNGMTSSAVMIDVAPNGTTEEPIQVEPVTVTDFQQDTSSNGTLLWDDTNPNDITGYKVFWDNGDPGLPIDQFSQLGAIVITTEKIITGLIEGSDYRFFVIKIDGSGNESGQSNLFNFNNMPPVQAPTITNFQIESSASGILEWEDTEPSNTLSHYEVFWDNANSTLTDEDFLSLGTVSNPMKTISIDNGNTYRFYVVRYDSDNDPSSPSNIYQVNVYIQPNIVNINSFSTTSNTQGTLSWSDNAVPLDLKEYRVYWDSGSSSLAIDDFSLIGTVTSPQESVSGLVGNTTYRFFVIKVNPANITSNRSNVYSYKHDIQPDAVTITSISVLNFSEVQVNWVDNQTPQDLLEYKVYGDNGNSSWPLDSFQLNKTTLDTQITISNLQNGQTYRFFVIKYNQAAVPSERSNLKSVTLNIAPQAVEITSFNISSNSDGSLYWQDIEGVADLSEYKLYWDNGDSGADPATGFTLLKSGLTSPSTSVTFENGNTYRFFVIKINSISLESPKSNIYQVDIAIKPQKVNIIDFTVLSGTSAILSWDDYESTDDLLKYEVWYDNGNTSLVAGENFVLAGVENSQKQYTFTNLVNGNDYRFYVVKYNDGGFNSPMSNIYTGVMNEPPASVTNLSFEVINPVSGTLHWIDPEPEDLLEYLIYSDEGEASKPIGSFIEVQDSSDTNATIDNLINGTTYRFYVKKRNRADLLSVSSILIYEFKADPVPVDTLSAEIDSLKNFNLQWNDPFPDDVTDYYIYGDNGDTSLSNSSFYLLKTTANTITRISGLVNGVTYRFYVKKKNLIGLISEQSEILTHQVLIKPDPVYVYIFEPINYTSGTLKWSDSDAADVLEYKVYWDNGNSQITSDNFSTLNSATTATSMIVSNMENNTTYRFYIKKINNFYLESDLSNIFSYTMHVAPNPVANLEAEIIDYKTIKLTWDHINKSGDTYSVYTNDSLYSDEITTKNCTLTDLENGTTYSFSIKVVNPSNISSALAYVQETIEILPEPITSIDLTVVSDTSVDITWSHVKAAEDFYKIFYKKVSTGDFLEITNIETKNYTISNLETGVEYNFEVIPIKATDVTGQSMGDNKLIALPPNKVNNLTHTVNKNSDGIFENIKLSWALPIPNNSDGFTVLAFSETNNIYYPIHEGDINSNTANEFILQKTNLWAGNIYDYIVRSYREFAGQKIYSENSNNIVVNLTTIPTLGVTVQSLESVQDSSGAYSGMKLNWTTPTGSYEKFVIYYWIDDALNPMKVDTTSTSYTFTNLILNTQYNFRVDSLNSYGMPTDSHNTLTVTTPKMPDPVTAINYYVMKDSTTGLYQKIKMSWSILLSPDDLDMVRIYKGLDSDSINYSTPVITAEAKLRNIEINQEPGNKTVYAIRYVNKHGIEETNTNKILTVDLSYPATVTNISSENLTDTKGFYSGFKLIWNSVSDAERYNIYVSKTDNFNFTAPDYILGKAIIFQNFEEIDYGSTYYFVVKSVNEYGIEDNSPITIVVDTPEKPSSISFSSHSYVSSNPDVTRLTELQLKWSLPNSPVKNIVFYSNNENSGIDYSSYELLAPDTTIKTIDSLQHGTEYKFALSILSNDNVESNISSELVITIPTAPVPVTYPSEAITVNKDANGLYESVRFYFSHSATTPEITKYNVYFNEVFNDILFDSADRVITYNSSINYCDFDFAVGKSYKICIRTVGLNNVEEENKEYQYVTVPDYSGVINSLAYTVVKDANNNFSTIKLIWNKEDNFRISGYNIYWDNGTGTLLDIPIQSITNSEKNSFVLNRTIEPDKNYLFSVRTMNSFGIENPQDVVVDVAIQKPVPVSNISYVVEKDFNGFFENIKLTWNHSDTVSKSEYVIYKNAVGSGIPNILIDSISATIDSYSLTDINPTEDYYFTVGVKDTNGMESISEEILSVNIPKSLPVSNINYSIVKDASGLFDGIKLNWDHSASTDKDKYVIYQNVNGSTTADVYKDSISSSINNYHIDQIQPDTNYYFKIGTRNISGVVNSDIADFLVNVARPNSANNLNNIFLVDVNNNITGVKVNWTHPSITSVSKFNLYWDNGAGTIDYNNPLQIFESNISEYIIPIENIELDKEYKYGIRVFGVNGLEEKNTEKVTQIKISRPESITNFNYSVVKDIDGNVNELKLIWNKYISSDFKEYTIMWNAGINSNADTVVATIEDVTTVEYVVNEPVIVNNEYLFKVVTTNLYNISDSGSEQLRVFVTDKAPFLTFKYKPVNKIQLNWDFEADSNTTNFRIFSNNGEGEINYSTPISTVSNTVRNYLLENLALSKDYKFAVAPTYSIGSDFDKSNEISFNTYVPEKLDSQKIGVDKDNTIIIKWSAPDNIDYLFNYKIYSDNKTGTMDYSVPFITTVKDINIFKSEPLEKNSVFKFVILACNEFGFHISNPAVVECEVTTEYNYSTGNLFCSSFIGNSLDMLIVRNEIERQVVKLADEHVEKYDRYFYDKHPDYLIFFFKVEKELRFATINKKTGIIQQATTIPSKIFDDGKIRGLTQLENYYTNAYDGLLIPRPTAPYYNLNHLRIMNINDRIVLRFREGKLIDGSMRRNYCYYEISEKIETNPEISELKFLGNAFPENFYST